MVDVNLPTFHPKPNNLNINSNEPLNPTWPRERDIHVYCEMSGADETGSSAVIDKKDFDLNRPLLTSRGDDTDEDGRRRWSSSSREEDDRASTLSDVVGEIVERDRKLMRGEVVRVSSFIWGVLSAYGITTPPCGRRSL